MIRFLLRGLAFVLLAYVLGYAWFAATLPRPADMQRTDAIVVLTGGSGRLDRGFDLLQHNASRQMLISGVARTVRPEELAVPYHVDPRLFACCIVLGRDSFDTRSNADEVARYVSRRHARSIRLVTNDLHMRRARFELAKRLPDEVTVIEDAVPTDPDTRAIFVEYNKYLLGRAADLVGI